LADAPRDGAEARGVNSALATGRMIDSGTALLSLLTHRAAGTGWPLASFQFKEVLL
jgi:hypothetical protein